MLSSSAVSVATQTPATRGFSFGKDSPVPLANVSFYYQYLQQEYVYKRNLFFRKELVDVREWTTDFLSITDGATRTIWLLAHRAKAFPVECRLQDGAEHLYQFAGYGSFGFPTVEQLLSH